MSMRCPPWLRLLWTSGGPSPWVAWCFVDLAESCGILGWNNKCSLSFKDTPERREKEKSGGKKLWKKVRKFGEALGCMWHCKSAAVFICLQGENGKRRRRRWPRREQGFSYNAQLVPFRKIRRVLLTIMGWMGNPPLAYMWLLMTVVSMAVYATTLRWFMLPESIPRKRTTGPAKVSFITGFHSGLIHICTYTVSIILNKVIVGGRDLIYSVTLHNSHHR